MDNFGLNVSQEAAQHIQNILGGLMSPNNQERGAAEESYHACKTENPDQMLATLLYLAAFSSDMSVRVMAALMFRKEVGIPGKENDFWTWKQASPQAQMIIKAALLNILQQDHPDDVRRKLGDGLSSLAISVLTLEDNSWPELLPFLLNLSEKEKPEVRATALEVLGAMANRIPEAIEGHFDSFIPFLQQKLQDPSTKVRISCFLLIYGLLTYCEEEPERIKMMQTIGAPVLESISACLHNSDFESGSLGMEYLVEMVELCPKFLRPNVFMMVELMFKITKSEQLEDSIRHLAVECMVTLAESKPGMVRKIPNFLEGILNLLLEWGTMLEENEDWNKGEAEDLEDTEAAVAEEAIDRLSIAMGGQTVVPILFAALPALLNSKEWTHRHSALIAIAVVGEGSKGYLAAHLDKLVPMVLPFGKDAHPRVRWAAMNALAQMCTDFQPEIQISFGEPILSCVVPVFDDNENPRVQSHAASTVVNFCEDCSKETIMPFAKAILEKLHSLLQSPRIVQEQVITAVAALADCIKEDFAPFYNYFMPFLKQVLNTATAKEFMLLRAKAMECASIVGVSVGKDVFGQDAKEIIDILNKIEFASDPSMPSMHMAWARLCKCLGTDFKPYLEMAMPQLLALASIQPKVEIIDTDKIEEYAEEWEVVPLGDQAMCIKTSEAEDKSTAINIIFCFCDEMGEHFFPYVQPVAELMANSLTFAYHDAVRNTAASCVPCLLLSTIQHLNSTGQGMAPAAELWKYLQPQLIKAIKKEIDSDAHVSMIEAYSECFDLIGEATHDPESLKLAAEAFNKVLKKYFDGRKNRSKARGEGEDEDFDEFDAEKLENMIERDDDVVALIAEMFGKLFKAYGPLYFPHFAPTIPTWKEFLQPGQRERDIQMAMCIFDDMTEHMQEAAAPHIADLFNFYGAICTNGNPDIRQASAFGLGLFAQHGGPAFGQVANNVCQALCQVITTDGSRDEPNVHPTENAISALGKICLYQSGSVDMAKFVPAFVSFLPVCEDKEESTVTYSTLAGLLDKVPELVLGSDSSKLPHVLHLFGGVLGSDLVNEKGTERIVTSIKRLEAANQKLFQEGCNALSQEEREKILHASNM